MSPIQQMLLGVGAVATKTYVDDIFSTYVYTGNGSARSINNGIDLSGEGGMVWIKKRNSATGGNSHIADTARGITKYLTSNENYAENTDANRTSATTSQGFSLGTVTTVNNNNDTYASWSFRKAPGFFDIVTYTGNGTAGRTVSHNLGCVPGCIMIKRLNGTADWKVYHRSTGAEKALALSNDAAAVDSDNYWNDTEPTASVFTLKQNTHLNADGGSYVAYVFAGGNSSDAAACSVNFNAGSDYLKTQSAQYNFGTGDFTIEFWVKLDTAIGTNATAAPGFFQLGTTDSLQDDFKWMTVRARNDSGGRWQMSIKSTSSTNPTTYSSAGGDYPHPGQWYHVALVRHSSKTSLYINGELKIGAIDDTTNYNFDDLLIGSYYANNYGLDGQISNFRIVKGSAVYTSSFKPPTAPLTSITNTLLLCCQSSTITAATTIPGTQTISSNGSPSANTSHPFDDLAGFVFGENEDQSVISTGSYVGSGSAGLEVNLGWEPQFLIIKRSNASKNWTMFDNMRGIATDGNDAFLYPNLSDAESATGDQLDLTPTGFKIKVTGAILNGSGDTYIYMAIRRPDGYVGKVELGTDVFAMDTGAGGTTIPNFDSLFPVDFTLGKTVASSTDWFANARLMGQKELAPNKTTAEDSGAYAVFDSNLGWGNASWQDSGNQSWMWKRHAGFDVVTYKGNDVAGRQILHSLNAVPEMMWIKRRDTTTSWYVYHKGLNGGSSPENYTLLLDSNSAEIDSNEPWNDTAPTATHFTLGDNSGTNGTTSGTFIAMLFASVDGISKVGSYTGTGSTQTITTGFQPRFLIIKKTNQIEHWWVLDTTRGWGSGNDKYLKLDTDAAQAEHDFGAPTSTGFTLVDGNSAYNANTENYIYYAHS